MNILVVVAVDKRPDKGRTTGRKRVVFRRYRWHVETKNDWLIHFRQWNHSIPATTLSVLLKETKRTLTVKWHSREVYLRVYKKSTEVFNLFMKGKLLNSRRIDLRFSVLLAVDISEFRVTLLKKDLSDRPKAIPSSEMQYDRSRLDHLPFLEFQGSPVAYHIGQPLRSRHYFTLYHKAFCWAGVTVRSGRYLHCAIVSSRSFSVPSMLTTVNYYHTSTTPHE